MTLELAVTALPRRRSVSMSCARAPVWTTVKVYGIRCLLPALRIRDFAQARSPKSNRIVSTRLARFLSVRRQRRQRRAGPTLSLDQVADPRSHPVVFSFLHLNFIAPIQIQHHQSVKFDNHLSFHHLHQRLSQLTTLTRQSAILSFYTIRPIRQLCLSPTLWNPLRHLEPIFTLRPFCNSAIICWTLPHVLSAHRATSQSRGRR